MKKRHIIKLNQEMPKEFTIIGISGTVSDSRISWLLNNELQIQLMLQPSAEEAVLKYATATDDHRYILLKNRASDVVLCRKYQNIHYFFVIVGLFDEWDSLKKALQNEREITAVFKLDESQFTKPFLHQYFLS